MDCDYLPVLAPKGGTQEVTNATIKFIVHTSRAVWSEKHLWGPQGLARVMNTIKRLEEYIKEVSRFWKLEDVLPRPAPRSPDSPRPKSPGLQVVCVKERSLR